MIISHVKIIAFQLSLFCKNYRFSKTVLYIINRKIHGCLEIPDLFLVLNMISHSFAPLTREISCSTLEINLVFPRTHVLFSIYFLSAILLSCMLSRVVYANNVQPHVPRDIVKRNAGSLIDDVRRDIAINFMLTCHKLSFLIGQFGVEV